MNTEVSMGVDRENMRSEPRPERIDHPFQRLVHFVARSPGEARALELSNDLEIKRYGSVIVWPKNLAA